MTVGFSRRRLLRRFVAATLGGLSLATVTSRAAAPGKVCADLDAMDSGARSMRSSLNYTESSPEADKTCLACAFFQPAAEGCGTCQIFSGAVDDK